MHFFPFKVKTRAPPSRRRASFEESDDDEKDVKLTAGEKKARRETAEMILAGQAEEHEAAGPSVPVQGTDLDRRYLLFSCPYLMNFTCVKLRTFDSK